MFRMYHDNETKLWMINIFVGANRVSVAVDTGSPFLVINSSQCRSCPMQYGSYREHSAPSGPEVISYATQKVRVRFQRDMVDELLPTKPFIFASADAMSSSEMPPVNVLGLQYSENPRSVCAQLRSIPFTLDFHNKLLVFGVKSRIANYVPWIPHIGVRGTVKADLSSQVLPVKVMIDSGTSFTRGKRILAGVPYTLNIGASKSIRTYNEPGQPTINGFDVVVGHTALRDSVVTFDYRNGLIGFA